MFRQRLTSGLGDQMFQYAAGYSLARRTGTRVRFHDPRPSLRELAYRFGLPVTPPPAHQLHSGLIDKYFGKGPGLLNGFRARAKASAFAKKYPSVFEPNLRDLGDGLMVEECDPRFFALENHHTLTGHYQSSFYFKDYDPEIRVLFHLLPDALSRTEKIANSWSQPANKRCAVYLDRTDDTSVHEGILAKLGAPLPDSFYQDAIRSLPEDTLFVVLPDDLDKAKKLFADVPHVFFASGEKPSVALGLMAECKTNIISLSSLAWWGAYLNPRKSKQIIAPRYHLGWKIRQWLPHGCEEPGWDYRDVCNVRESETQPPPSLDSQ
jgi:hypothetical protein